MAEFRIPPGNKHLQGALDKAAPGHRLQNVSLAPAGFSNATFFLDTLSPEGKPERFVLRQYNPDNEPPTRKAPREYRALEQLFGHGLPVPRPLLLDASGELLGAPSLITSFLLGRPWVGMAQPRRWVRELATMLARIHSVPLPVEREALMDGNPNVAWFALRESLPHFLVSHPDGDALWQVAYTAWPCIRPAQPVFLHIDFWAGNLLWHEGRLSGVLDWEEAGWGDPGIDVAYARLELSLLGLPQAADELLRAYEKLCGRQVENLAFWELAAAVRAFPDPAGWWHEWQVLGAQGSTEDEVRRRLRGFIQSALNRIK